MDARTAVFTRRRALLGAGAMVGVSAFSHSAAQTTPIEAWPKKVDLSHLMTPVKDQGDRDTCAFFVVTAMLEARIAHDTGKSTPLSEQFLIYVLKSGEGRGGTEFSSPVDVVNAVEEHGVPSQAAWPYNPRSRFGRGQPCAKFIRGRAKNGALYGAAPESDASCIAHDRPPPAVFEEALTRRRWANFAAQSEVPVSWDPPTLDNSRLRGIMRQMAIFGMPVILTVSMPNGGVTWLNDGRVTIPDSLRGAPAQQLEQVPNHFVVLTGYDRTRGEFTFRNSWGRGWGNNGYGVIAFDIVTSPFVKHGTFFIRPPK